MKHLFIARHGNYGEDDLISARGIAQMETLGHRIKDILNGGSAYIISSTAPRALGSSQVLSNILTSPGEFEQAPYLWSGTDSPKDSYYHDPKPEKLIEIINQYRDKADGLIIVSHLEVTNRLPGYFFRKEFDKTVALPGIEKGEAAHIDIATQMYQRLRQC